MYGVAERLRKQVHAIEMAFDQPLGEVKARWDVLAEVVVKADERGNPVSLDMRHRVGERSHRHPLTIGCRA